MYLVDSNGTDGSQQNCAGKPAGSPKKKLTHEIIHGKCISPKADDLSTERYKDRDLIIQYGMKTRRTGCRKRHLGAFVGVQTSSLTS